MDIPIENQRVKILINYYCDGNELLFSKEIGISQPRINRLFSIDSRNDKYPMVTYDIAQSIINKFIEVSADWLLTGKGSMLKSAVKKEVQGLDPPDTGHYKELAAARLEIIEGLKFKVATLEKELYVQKLTQGDPIVNEIVAKPTPELTV